MAKCFPLFLLAMAALFVSAAAQDAPVGLPPALDSLKLSAVALNGYRHADSAETHLLAPCDSVFLYDGALYFRARAGGRNFFVAREDIVKRSDSLVVYQTMRINPSMQTAGQSDSTIAVKTERQRCTAITKNGTRCRRMALTGSDKCWQHKK